MAAKPTKPKGKGKGRPSSTKRTRKKAAPTRPVDQAERPAKSTESRADYATRWKPGQSGNPAGRQPGSLNTVHRLVRERLEAKASDIVDALIGRACAVRETESGVVFCGSTDALAECMSRLSPPPRHGPREPWPLGELTDLEQCTKEARRLAAATAAGELDPDHASDIARRIAEVAKLIEIDVLEKRVAALEKAAEAQRTSGVNGHAYF